MNPIRIALYCLALMAGAIACKTTEKTSQKTPVDSVALADQPQMDITGQLILPKDELEDPEVEEEAPVWVHEPAPYQPAKTLPFDLANTLLDVRFDWARQRLLGKAELLMKPHFYPQEKVVLDAKNFDIHSVALVGKKDTMRLVFQYDSLQLTIQLGKTYTRNEELKLRIYYTAKPNERKTGGSAAITSDKGLYFINPANKNPYKPQQIWTQGETEANSCWFPTFDSPNVKTKQEIYITVDTAFKTLSNGKLISSKKNPNGTRTDYWKQELPHAPYLFMMAIGKFAVVQDKPWNGKPVDYYVEPEYAPYAKSVFGNTPEMMTFFSDLLKYPYPWEKYSQVVVRDYVSGAMENTSASIFMEQLHVDDRYLLDDNWDQIIAHELFHQWFGDIVTCESWANLPLNESFANYSEYLWLEHKYGKEAAAMMWEEELDTYLAEAESKREPLIRYRHFDREDMFDSHSYAKGCLTLHFLRDQVGDEAFFEAIRRYLKANEFKAAEIHHLRLAFEEVTGQDLNWFFDQFFLQAGHPELNVAHSYADGKLSVRIRQLQNPKYTPIYQFPTKVAVWHGEKKTVHTLFLDSAYKEFFIPMSQVPSLVLFDPERTIPGTIDYLKTTEEFIYQFENAPHPLARLDALRQLSNGMDDPQIRAVVKKALYDSLWSVRELAVTVCEGYEYDDQAEVVAKIRQMATTDPKSLVRAQAVNALASLGEAHLDVVEKCLQDPSYTVLATSLYAYANLGGIDPLKKVQQFESSESLTLIITLADFYSYMGTPDKLDWFVGKMRKRGGQELAFLFNYFGGYLMNRPRETQEQGIEVIRAFLGQEPNADVRMAIYRTLGLFTELPGAKAMMQKMELEETDAQAIRFYQMMQE